MEITWIIGNMLAQSRRPYARDQINDLYNKGIRAIVSLVKSDRNIINFIKEEKGMEYLEEYVKDLDAPTIDQLIRINKFINSMINKKKPVLVHCFAAGRSGTVLVSYLIYHGKSFNDSLSEVRDKISLSAISKKRYGFAVNSRPQEERLKEFEMYVRKKIKTK